MDLVFYEPDITFKPHKCRIIGIFDIDDEVIDNTSCTLFVSEYRIVRDMFIPIFCLTC